MTTNEPLPTSNLLVTILETFPFIVPVRQVVDEDKNTVIEWQWEGKYFDIEDAGDGHIEIFSQVNGVSRHWILTPVDMAKESTRPITSTEYMSAYLREKAQADDLRKMLNEQIEHTARAIADYEEVNADHRRLVRGLDVALNGEAGAAKQASLCDIVAQVEKLKVRREHTARRTLVERAESLLSFLESDFGQSGRDVRIEAIVCEFEGLLGISAKDTQAPMLKAVQKNKAPKRLAMMAFVEFTGEYEKQYYDVCTADGTIIKHCWPNAGKMVAMDGSGRMWGQYDGVGVRPSEDHPLGERNDILAERREP